VKEKKHVDTNRTEDLFINKSEAEKERKRQLIKYQTKQKTINSQAWRTKLNREEKKDECRDVALDPPLKDLSNSQK